jgi:coproporphyrinogen III oxidase-like Fe-S oxidoreductase
MARDAGQPEPAGSFRCCRRRPGSGRTAAIQFRSPPPLSLYVHIPWCVQKCPYCDFNSHALPGTQPHRGAGRSPKDDYLTALIADLESALPLVWGRRVDSIFLGGGTPSLLSGEGSINCWRPCAAACPSCPTPRSRSKPIREPSRPPALQPFAPPAINRLSLGIQSFNPQHLKALGRIHDDHEARRAITIAASHFDNFNLDLMYGLPGQTLAEALADLDAALAFSPPHLSCYQLTIEANTAFAARPPALPEADDLCADMQDAIEARLAAPATCITKPRPSQNLAGSASTTSTTGISATIWGSVPARMAS